MKNKKGSIYLGFVFALFFLMVGVMMIPLFQDSVTTQRANIGCSTNSSISDGAKLMCLTVLDTAVPYYIIGILILVGGFIGHEI